MKDGLLCFSIGLPAQELAVPEFPSSAALAENKDVRLYSRKVACSSVAPTRSIGNSGSACVAVHELSFGCCSCIQTPSARGNSQREMEICSARLVVRGPEPATMGLNNRSADTKPHTGAVLLSRKESVEYLTSLVSGKSNASVCDPYQKLFAVIILGAEGELTRAVDGLHCVDTVD